MVSGAPRAIAESDSRNFAANAAQLLQNERFPAVLFNLIVGSLMVRTMQGKCGRSQLLRIIKWQSQMNTHDPIVCSELHTLFSRIVNLCKASPTDDPVVPMMHFVSEDELQMLTDDMEYMRGELKKIPMPAVSVSNTTFSTGLRVRDIWGTIHGDSCRERSFLFTDDTGIQKSHFWKLAEMPKK